MNRPGDFNACLSCCDRLSATTRFYPLRFHCIRLLIKLSQLTPSFVPVLPFLLEMFDMTDFNKRHKTASLKAQYINFNTSLKLSKLQMNDRAYKVRFLFVIGTITE
jgi:nucleolar complex protein 2